MAARVRDRLVRYSPVRQAHLELGGLKVMDDEKAISYAPLRLGIHAIGTLGIAETQLSYATLEALGPLITIAIERARAIEQVGKFEALRESDRLKSALLDAITHEFRTPLTAMKISVTGMLSDLNFDREQCRDLLAMIDEGCEGRSPDLVIKIRERVTSSTKWSIRLPKIQRITPDLRFDQSSPEVTQAHDLRVSMGLRQIASAYPFLRNP
jgi:signal transduction histidine kinase